MTVENEPRTAPGKPTRREERRAQTVREIKALAMEQVSEGGPDALSLSGIVRQMAMSQAAVYRYFANRDALLADLVVDAYDELADALVASASASVSASAAASDPAARLDAVLRGTRAWALDHPNAYRLIFQTSLGSGKDFAAERTVPASSRSMTVLVEALAAVAGSRPAPETVDLPPTTTTFSDAIHEWAERTGLVGVSEEALALGMITWTRLHGVISLELGGHLAATGIGAPAIFDAEVATIAWQAARLPRT